MPYHFLHEHGFMKGNDLTNLIFLYDKKTCLADRGNAADSVYLDFCKAFDTIFSQRNCLLMIWTDI